MRGSCYFESDVKVRGLPECFQEILQEIKCNQETEIKILKDISTILSDDFF
jgi:hypothetical protein